MATGSLEVCSWPGKSSVDALVKWRLHTQFEVEKYVPTRIDVTPNGGGKRDEGAVMESTVEAGR
jgi:hypothetical protein